MGSEKDKRFMRLALELAEKSRGRTSPNPLVGAVIVKNGRIVGRGYHKKAGSAHAEINALKAARRYANGATLYVNLEPCCHYGRTSPCTEEIIKAGIKRGVFSIKDPNPLVAGRGAGQLRKAGIDVDFGLLKNEAQNLNEVYLKYIRSGRPFVTLKTAQTLDGRIATTAGNSKWITGTKARKLAHQLRAENDAVVVGSGTVRNDNPQLTVRSVRGNNPYRIIVSRRVNFSGSLKLFKNNDDARTILATTKKSVGKMKAKNLIVWTIRENKDGLSPADLLDKAGQFGITSLLIEGGGALATSFIKAGLIDKHYLFIAPKIIGAGINAVGDLKVRTISRAVMFKKIEYDCKTYAPDMLFVGYPER
jgi:diaminohydroxyphosphoribosylaminopyrimidine deaminase/5-amino-6-(5-phosphoribosylamino)uracil reductase